MISIWYSKYPNTVKLKYIVFKNVMIILHFLRVTGQQCPLLTGQQPLKQPIAVDTPRGAARVASYKSSVILFYLVDLRSVGFYRLNPFCNIDWSGLQKLRETYGCAVLTG